MSGLVEVLTPEDECRDILRALLDKGAHKDRPLIVTLTVDHARVAMACPNGTRALAAAHAALEVFEDVGAQALLAISDRARQAVDPALQQIEQEGHQGPHRARVHEARLRWDAVLATVKADLVSAPSRAKRH